MSDMVRLDDVTRIYNQGRPNEVRPVDRVSLAIGVGEIAVVRGPSGSGKTTLLALIGCMCRPTSGRILVAGRDVAKLPERFLTQVRRETFGDLRDQGKTIVIATHDPLVYDSPLVDRVLTMRDGRIVAGGAA